MEGLIPMVYKSLKKMQTRRKYEFLSSGAAQPYNIADFYVRDDRDHEYFSRIPDDMSDRFGAHHRRSKSVVVGGCFGLVGGSSPPKPKQLVKFRSHRMLSCITGA